MKRELCKSVSALACVAAFALLGSCASSSRARIVAFGGAEQGVFSASLRVTSVSVAKAARAEPIREESERLARAIARSNGFTVVSDGEIAEYALSLIISENEFVKGLYRLRSVLVEAVLSAEADGSIVSHVRLERESENTLDSSLFLDEVLRAALDALSAQLAKRLAAAAP